MWAISYGSSTIAFEVDRMLHSKVMSIQGPPNPPRREKLQHTSGGAKVMHPRKTSKVAVPMVSADGLGNPDSGVWLDH